MRHAPAVLFAALAVLLVVRAAGADEYNLNGTITQGTGIQTATPAGATGGSKLVIQCPNIDGGSGQLVYYRPGGCSSCPVDAGPGDYLIDFRTNTDGYPVVLRAGMNRIHLRAYTATDAVYCAVIPKSP